MFKRPEFGSNHVQRDERNNFSPFPEDYPVRDVFKGVNIYTTIPNRYPYMYDRQAYPGLYYDDFPRKNHSCVEGYRRITPKVFPYTNRPWTDNIIYEKPVVYESLLDDRNLRVDHTFYKM